MTLAVPHQSDHRDQTEAPHENGLGVNVELEGGENLAGKLMLMLVFLVGGLLFLVFGVVLLPLIPILMIAGAIWLALRLFRPATA